MTASDPIRREANRLLSSGLLSSLRSPAGRFVLGYLRPLRSRLALIAGLAVVQSIADGLRMVLILAVLRVLLEGTIAPSKGMIFGLPFALPVSPSWLLPLALVAILILEALDWTRKHLSAAAQRDFVETLRADTMYRVLRQPLDYFTSQRSGSAAYLVNSQVARLSLFLPMASDLVGTVCTLLVMASLMAWMQPMWTGVVVAGACGIWLANRSIYRILHGLGLAIAAGSTDAAAIVQDAIRGIKLVKTCHTERFEADKASRAARAVAETQVRATGWRNLGKSIQTAAMFWLILGVAVLGAGGQGAGTLLAFLVILARCVPLLGTMGDARMQVATAMGHILQVAELPETKEPPRVILKQEGWTGGVLQFSGVYFSHGEKRVIQDLNLTVEAGIPTALVGLTGSGKSTLLDLAAGLRRPEGGWVGISVHGGVSYLTQEPILMFGTVKDNIFYGGDFRPLSISASALFLANGIDTATHPVGEAGSALSGGQRQQVCLLRLEERQSTVWLLDEPTSSMDAESEAGWIGRILQGWADKKSRVRIILLATHNLRIARRFPRIVVLNHGRIEADGTHEELVKQDGLYVRLWKLQEATES